MRIEAFEDDSEAEGSGGEMDIKELRAKKQALARKVAEQQRRQDKIQVGRAVQLQRSSWLRSCFCTWADPASLRHRTSASQDLTHQDQRPLRMSRSTLSFPSVGALRCLSETQQQA